MVADFYSEERFSKYSNSVLIPPIYGNERP